MRTKAPKCEKCKSKYAMLRLYVKGYLSPMRKPKTWYSVGWICKDCLNVVIDKALLNRVHWRVQKRVILKEKKKQEEEAKRKFLM